MSKDECKTKWYDRLRPVAKAIAGAIVGAASYLMGVIPAQGGFSDVTLQQWLGLVVALGAGFGIVWRVPNKPK